MQPETSQPGVWHEQSAIWEIVSGEIVRQHSDPDLPEPAELMARAAERSSDAAEMMRTGDHDAAGHALIGCALSLGLAARASSPPGVPIDRYGAELAATVASQASEPTPEVVAALAEKVSRRTRTEDGFGPTPWELAVTAGACAAGLTAHITRRRNRRDLATS